MSECCGACANKDNDFSLEFDFLKSDVKTDERGNYIIEVEASNENLDLQGQKVLQSALMQSKDEFLRGGVISFDHLHKRKDEDGKVISDPAMVIGEPVDVKTDGKKTIVVGKLYKHNKIAKDLIRKLKDGSTRIRASVGGIFPKIVKDAKTGIEKVTSVFWNDLALTTSPVNNTVGAACFAKSFTAAEFVKALEAGSGTEHADFKDGRALIKEDAEGKAADVPEDRLRDAVEKLVSELKEGKIADKNDALNFLIKQGMNNIEARLALREIKLEGENYEQIFRCGFFDS